MRITLTDSEAEYLKKVLRYRLLAVLDSPFEITLEEVLQLLKLIEKL